MSKVRAPGPALTRILSPRAERRIKQENCKKKGQERPEEGLTGSKTGQECPKKPQESPRRPQDGPKTPIVPKIGQNIVLLYVFCTRKRPRRAQKGTPRGPKEAVFHKYVFLRISASWGLLGASWGPEAWFEWARRSKTPIFLKSHMFLAIFWTPEQNAPPFLGSFVLARGSPGRGI